MNFDHQKDNTGGALKGLLSMLGVPVFVLVVLLIASRCQGETVRLQWNPNPEPDITGYQVAYGIVTGEHPNTIETGAETTADLPGLIPGRTYYIVLRAIVRGGLISPPSEEIAITIPSKSPPPPSAPTGLRVVEIQTSSNLQDWESLAFIQLSADRKFVRTRITNIP